MNNKFKEKEIKNRTYYFFDDIISFDDKKFDQNKMKINEKSYKNLLIYYIGYVTIKVLSYIKIWSVNFLNLTITQKNGYIRK